MAPATLTLIPYQYQSRQTYGELTIVISQAQFKGVQYQEGKSIFAFNDCYIEKVIIENPDQIDFLSHDIDLNFTECYVGAIEIKQLVTENLGIWACASLVELVIDNRALKRVELNNCLIKDRLFLTNIEKVRISFSKENMRSSEQWVQLISGLPGQNPVALYNGKQSYHLYQCKEIDFSSNYKNEPQWPINLHLNIHFTKELEDESTKIKNVTFKGLYLKGPARGKVEIEDAFVDEWHLSEFSTEKEANFYNIRPSTFPDKALIGIDRCNFANVWFNNIYFIQYGIVAIYRTRFADSQFTSCDFPSDYNTFTNFKPIPNVHYPDKVTQNMHKDLFEMFLQLKSVMEDGGNYYEAQKLQAMAHEALRKIKSITWSDRIILWFNSISYTHGLSIFRPFWGMFIFSIPLYILYLWSLGRMFNCNGFDSKLIGQFFSFVDITHRADFLVDKDKLTGWAHFLDWFNKLWVGFFIYQFIATFRKYGKN